MDAPTKSPLALTPDQQDKLIKMRVERFKEKYDKIVAETGLMHFALLSTPAGDISVPLLILPINLGNEKKKPVLDAA
jgi:hypothetical protein